MLFLIKAHPEDSKYWDGHPYWNENKRFPLVCDFDPNDETHLMFILFTANILSLTYEIFQSKAEMEHSLHAVKAIVSKLNPLISCDMIICKEAQLFLKFPSRCPFGSHVFLMIQSSLRRAILVIELSWDSFRL